MSLGKGSSKNPNGSFSVPLSPPPTHTHTYHIMSSLVLYFPLTLDTSVTESTIPADYAVSLTWWKDHVGVTDSG